MFENVLKRPRAYAFSQWLWYRRGQQEHYVRHWIRPQPGNRVLDIGCGPARLLDWMPDVLYVGYDPNPDYIADAQRRYGSRGQFHVGTLTELRPDQLESFDIVLANGVLHHVSDNAATSLLEMASYALKPGGRMVTRDGCYEPGQSAFVQFLMRMDRGRFVRTQTEYEALFRDRFATRRCAILRDALRLPYSLIHFDLVKKEGEPSLPGR